MEYGYNISSYSDYHKHEKSIILRHDVDFSPSKALEVAEIEYALDVKSTYFVLLSTEFYNVFSKETSEILKRILGMGYEVGLHFDELRYESASLDEIKKRIYQEAEILGKALDTRIKTVSMHRPSKFTLESSMELDGLLNSYSNKYFRDMKYISDSRMYRREDPHETICSKLHKRIHILTHPFWYNTVNENTKDKLEQFILSSLEERYRCLDNNFRELEEFVTLYSLNRNVREAE
jgi:peptidoglycan/xylan/chitin deacetylase (PgdA/CDA1 family)